MSVEKPKSLQKNLEIRERLQMTAGITNMNPRVKAAMIWPLLAPSDPQLQQILRDIIEGIRYVFQTTNRYSFAITGSTCLAFETAVCNLLKADDKVLVLVHGVDAERMAKTSKTFGFRLIRLKVANPGDLVEKDSIRKALKAHNPKLLYLAHGDSSSGTLQPLRGIGEICHQNDCLLMVDASTTVGCCPLASDQMEIDVLIAATQYALGVSPGLTLMSFGDRAMNKIKERKKDKISNTMNLDLLAQSWGLGDDQKYVYHYTHSISLLYALRESLAMVSEEGLDRMIERHIKFSLIAQKAIKRIGLRFLVEAEQNRLTSVLIIIVPDAVKRDAIIDYMTKYYDVVISNGVSPIDKVWRIGILGQNANRRSVKLMTTVLREAIDVSKNSSKSSNSSLNSASSI